MVKIYNNCLYDDTDVCCSPSENTRSAKTQQSLLASDFACLTYLFIISMCQNKFK